MQIAFPIGFMGGAGGGGGGINFFAWSNHSTGASPNKSAYSLDGIDFTAADFVPPSFGGNYSARNFLVNNEWLFGTASVAIDGSSFGSGGGGVSPPYGCAFGGGYYVAAGIGSGDTGSIAYSTSLNGPWTVVQLATRISGSASPNLYGIIYDGSKFITQAGDGRIYNCTNPANWTLRYTPSTLSEQGNFQMDFSNGNYVTRSALANNVISYVHSSDGDTWVEKTISGLGSAVCNALVYNSTSNVWLLYFGKGVGAQVATSATPSNSASWTITSITPASVTGTINGLACVGGTYVLYGAGSPQAPAIEYSLTGTSGWTASNISALTGANYQQAILAYRKG